MNLLLNRKRARRVLPQSVLDFKTFTERQAISTNSKELKIFEKYIVARMLIREGYDTYLNPTLKPDDSSLTFEADACGLREDQLIVAICTARLPTSQEWDAVRQAVRAENALALILSPHEVDRETLEYVVPGALANQKVRIELLGWFEDNLERTLQDTLRTIELLVNETRMRMMAPLLHKSALKKDLRARINPKLVYHNLTALSEAGLVDEPIEGTYELSQLGTTLMAEFIAFLERTRRTLDDHKQEEVKLIGRR